MNNVFKILEQANSLTASGLVIEAIDLLNKQYRASNNTPDIHFLLIQSLQHQKQFFQSKVIIEDAKVKFGILPRLLYLDSVQAQESGEPEEAILLLKQFVKIKNDNAFVWANLCQLLEQMNRLEELDLTIKSVPDQFRELPLICLVRAKFHRRNSDYKKALSILSRVKIDSLEDWQKAAIYFEYSRLYDNLKDYEKAWDSASKANQFSASIWPQQWQKSDEIEAMLVKSLELECEKIDTLGVASNHVFLIGFPRSGTTLLDKVLDAHSEISVMDEQPVLESLVNQLGGINYTENLPKLDESQKLDLRKIYWDKVSEINQQFIEQPVFIDKLPMNIIYLPIIKTIFPDAKIIFAIRHPLDCCLSCFFQEFKLIAPLAKFLDINKTINFYHQVFTTATNILEDDLQQIKEIRYEDVLNNFEATITKLVNFLNLEWQPQMQQFHKYAQGQKINTPSYHQVTKPLYKNAIYRWRHYQKYLSEAEQKLQKWIEKFGYQK